VTVVRAEVLEEHIASIIRVTRIAKLVVQVFVHSVFQLLVSANIVPSSPILITLMMEMICSSKTSVLTRATWGIIPEDGILNTYTDIHNPIFDATVKHIPCNNEPPTHLPMPPYSHTVILLLLSTVKIHLKSD
jgi:hypothetical protein